MDGPGTPLTAGQPEEEEPFWRLPETLKRMSRRISRTQAPYVPPVSSDKTAQKLLREHLPWVPAPLYGLITYYRFLFSYMAALSFLGSFIIYGLERESCSYTSAAFTAVSAVTQKGLIVLDTSALRGGTQAVILLLIIAGSGVLSSLIPITLRRQVFIWQPSAVPRRLNISSELVRASMLGSRASAGGPQRLRNNVHFAALTLMRRIIAGYYAANVGLAFLALGIYCSSQPSARAALDESNTGPWWFALFHAVSAFGNAGFSIFAANLIPLRREAFVLNILSWLVLAGNVCFPIFLHLFVSAWWRISRRRDACSWRTLVLEYIVSNPRACALQLLPTSVTVTLALVIGALSAIDLIVTLGYDLDTQYFADLGGYERINLAWFTAVQPRTAGFNALDIATLAWPTLILWVGARLRSLARRHARAALSFSLLRRSQPRARPITNLA
jgi:Trk-type K+ transport system membrane component